MAIRNLPSDVVEALRRGNKIEAIKRLREATGLGLAEAKSVVDAHGDAAVGSGSAGTPHAGKAASAAMHAHAKAPMSRPGLSPGEMPRASVPAAAIVAIVIAVAALFFFLKG